MNIEKTISSKKSCAECGAKIPKGVLVPRVYSSYFRGKVSFRVLCPDCMARWVFLTYPKLLRPKIRKEVMAKVGAEKI